MKITTFEEYDKAAAVTAIYPKERGMEYVTLGLVSEAGEIAGKLKKVIRDNGGVMSDEVKKELLKELGDVMWYVSAIAGELGSSTQKVAEANIDKLHSRMNRGMISGSGDNR